jgi:hypothetical protein
VVNESTGLHKPVRHCQHTDRKLSEAPTNFKKNYAKAIYVMDFAERSLRLLLTFRVTVHVASNIRVWPSRGEVKLRSTELKAHDPRLRDVDSFFRLRSFVRFQESRKEKNVFATKTFVNLAESKARTDFGYLVMNG